MWAPLGKFWMNHCARTSTPALQRYAVARPMLEHVAEAMRTRIESLFEETENTPLFVVSRVKTVESFRDKASRMFIGEEGEAPALEFPNPLREIHDLVGVRVIVKLPHEIREAANLIKRRRSDFDCRSDREKDIGSVESGTYGYSSRHLILKTRGEEVVRDFQAKLGGEIKITGNFVFEVQIRTILSHAWSEIEHDIRFKNAEPRAWSPHIDRQFTATAAMLEAVEDQFSELHERFQTVTGFWDAEGEGAVPLARRAHPVHLADTAAARGQEIRRRLGLGGGIAGRPRAHPHPRICRVASAQRHHLGACRP